jgi:hypothetical protein
MKYIIALLCSTLSISAAQVGPLLTTEWGQKAPWNQYCPADSNGFGGHSPTGCLPVAVAQVMNYYRSPAIGYGSAVSQSQYGLLSVDIGSHTIDWDTDEGIALLMYELGVATGARYGSRSTGTNVGAVPMKTNMHWNYQFGQDNIFDGAYDDSTWHSILQYQLDISRPVIYGGRGPCPSGTCGHAFVIDGYNDQGEYHVNWGAAGNYNGWYSLDDLTPGPYDFTENQRMLLRFYPRERCLIVPKDREQRFNYQRVPLYWRDIGDSYTLQVSKYPTMRGLVISAQELEVTSYRADLEPNTTYFWRVYIYGGEYEGWSRINSFTTGG